MKLDNTTIDEALKNGIIASLGIIVFDHYVLIRIIKIPSN